VSVAVDAGAVFQSVLFGDQRWALPVDEVALDFLPVLVIANLAAMLMSASADRPLRGDGITASASRQWLSLRRVRDSLQTGLSKHAKVDSWSPESGHGNSKRVTTTCVQIVSKTLPNTHQNRCA